MLSDDFKELGQIIRNRMRSPEAEKLIHDSMDKGFDVFWAQSFEVKYFMDIGAPQEFYARLKTLTTGAYAQGTEDGSNIFIDCLVKLVKEEESKP